MRLKDANDRLPLDLIEHVADVELDAHVRRVGYQMHPDDVDKHIEPALRGCPELLRLEEDLQVTMKVPRDCPADDA